MNRNWETAYEKIHTIETMIAELHAIWPHSPSPTLTAHWHKMIDELKESARAIRGAAATEVDMERMRRQAENNAPCTREAGDHTYTYPCDLAPGTGSLWRKL